MTITRHRFVRGIRKAIRPFRRIWASQPPQHDLTALSGPVLILLAHPDDEVFCSGLISKLRQRQVPVHLLLFTRGEGGERGSLPPESDLAQVREQEMRDASQQLGVTSLSFLNYQDPAAVNDQLIAPEYETARLQSEIETELKKNKIAHLITHGSSGEYWHPAHLSLHRSARHIARRNANLQLWTFNAYRQDHPLPAILNQDDPASLLIEGSQEIKIRLAALTCHRSQRAVFERFASGTLSDFITKTTIECYRKW